MIKKIASRQKKGKVHLFSRLSLAALQFVCSKPVYSLYREVKQNNIICFSSFLIDTILYLCGVQPEVGHVP